MGNRNIINSYEIENYFKNEGFELISPNEYSLDEKRKIFQEAKIIAGPSSGGFTNIIFCQPNTNILVFVNYQRVYELYLSSISDYFNLHLCAVTGSDKRPYGVNNSYYISKEKIIRAYKMLSNE